MDENQRKLKKSRSKLLTQEITLKKKLKNCVDVIPTDDNVDLVFSPSVSLQSTMDNPSQCSTPTRENLTSSLYANSSVASSTTSHVSTSSRRSHDAMVTPYIIIEDLRKLEETYGRYEVVAEDYWELLDEDSDAYNRALSKREYYNEFVDNVIFAVEERIWELCTIQQIPLPSRCPQELRRWSRYNSGMDIIPGFIPPKEHRNQDSVLQGNLSKESIASQDFSSNFKKSSLLSPAKALIKDLLSIT